MAQPPTRFGFKFFCQYQYHDEIADTREHVKKLKQPGLLTIMMFYRLINFATLHKLTLVDPYVACMWFIANKLRDRMVLNVRQNKLLTYLEEKPVYQHIP